ncbi:MAG: hypothetical protein ABI379_07300 [Rhodanobacter sp.]
MDFLGSPFLLAAVCAYTYYLLGTHDGQHSGKAIGLLWAVISLVASLFVLDVFNGGWAWLLLAQILLFFAIAAFRAIREG